MGRVLPASASIMQAARTEIQLLPCPKMCRESGPQAQAVLKQDPFAGRPFVLRIRRDDPGLNPTP
ncbi:MAG: hypothetical protein QM682_15820 [Paracoccus sp. (in: a-proteobacteria)]|uniref:hypothetical protein n=1 Tax=Paracoccus sp. TaxID=267 RepID=UPI0039E5C12E